MAFKGGWIELGDEVDDGEWIAESGEPIDLEITYWMPEEFFKTPPPAPK